MAAEDAYSVVEASTCAEARTKAPIEGNTVKPRRKSSRLPKVASVPEPDAPVILSSDVHGINPDLIYLDVRLPKMDGFEVLERLRADVATAAIPVVIVTNYGEPELQQRGLSLGALEFLVKADTTPARLSETFERLSETESVRS